MTESEVRTGVREVFGAALGRAVGPDENVTQGDDAAWDSVKHVELVMMLEERFGLTFEPEDFAELTSLDECVRRVAERTAG